MLPSFIRHHPIWSAIASFVFFAVVTFPIWLAQVWTLVSDRPFAEDMAKRHWGFLVITPVYGWVCVGIGLLILGAVALIAVEQRDSLRRESGADGEDEGPLTIMAASYGIDGNYKNVTTILESHIHGNKIDIPVTDLALHGDPFPDQLKHVKVVYSVGAKQHRIVRRDGDRLVVPEEAASKPDSIHVTIFSHDEAARTNGALPVTIREFFQAGGWDVSLGQTNLPRHAKGVWVHGGQPFERSAAMWALTALGQQPQLDDSDDGASLQVIVGAVEPTKPKEPEPKPSEAKPKPVEWLSDAERRGATESLAAPDAPKQISDDEFEIVEKRDKHGSLFLRVENLKEEAKTNYLVRISEIRIWSKKLNGGAGGFAPWPGFVDRNNKPIPTHETGGIPGRFDHVTPKQFELVRNPGTGPWHLRGADGTSLGLVDGVWRLSAELHWNGGVRATQIHLRLRTDGPTKSAEFVSPNIES